MLFKERFYRLPGRRTDLAGFVAAPLGSALEESRFFRGIVIPVGYSPPAVASHMGLDKLVVQINLDYFTAQLNVYPLAHVPVRDGIKGAGYLDMAIEGYLGLMPGNYLKGRHRQRL
jgi:hypothetical protein